MNNAGLTLGIAIAAGAAVDPLSWKTTFHELGQVKTGESTPVEFEFTNNSNEAITILDAKGSCVCTEVSFPKEVIEPGNGPY